MLLCPVCHEPLVDNERGAACAGGHRFDRAREGYLYLLRSSKSGDSMGDPKSQARSRRDFLNRGYYAPLRDTMVELVRERAQRCAATSDKSLPLLDICCGEGYYTSAMGAVPGVDAYGFDLGKEMVRLAAKRGDATYFVANMKDIPVADGAFDMVTELFAPFNEREFARVLAPEGSLYTVVPGARHLFAEDHRARVSRNAAGVCEHYAPDSGRHRGGVPDDAVLLPHAPCRQRAPGKLGHPSNRHRLHHRRVPPQLTTSQKRDRFILVGFI